MICIGYVLTCLFVAYPRWALLPLERYVEPVIADDSENTSLTRGRAMRSSQSSNCNGIFLNIAKPKPRTERCHAGLRICCVAKIMHSCCICPIANYH